MINNQSPRDPLCCLACASQMAFLSYTSFQSYVASPFFLLTRVMDLVYLADMGVSAVTIYFDKEKQVWVSDPRRILRRYLR